MTTLTADSSLQSALGSLEELTEIRSTDGTLLGTFAPARQDVGPALRRVAIESYLQELRRRAASKEVFTFEEMMARIRSREHAQ